MFRDTVCLRTPDNHAGPGSVGGRLAHAAVTSEHSGSFLAQDSASLVHFMDFWAIDRMNDRNLIGMDGGFRSEEHTYELQSLMRISYAVFCLKKKKNLTTLHR